MLLAAIAMIGALAGAAHASTGKRVALVIGNSNYMHAPPLANPANDANDMAVTLRGLGFNVVEGKDLTRDAMTKKVREFTNLLRGADIGMLFYAGHGLQVDGENYLAPIDAKLLQDTDLDFEAVKLSFIQDQMERQTDTVLLFLDACRDNPLVKKIKGKSRSISRGLAEVKSASGTLIAFATAPNDVALDGSGRNSPFTTALLENISRPNVEIQTMMTDVRQQVYTTTDEKQTPWINSSLLGRFYFLASDEPAEPETIKVVSVETEGASVSRSASKSEAAMAWDTVKDSESAEELRLFVLTYPNSFQAKVARLRISKLEERKTGTAVPEQKVASLDTGASVSDVSGSDVTGPEAWSARARELRAEFSPREITLKVQSALDRLNCAPGRPDGVWGRRSRGALERLRSSTELDPITFDPEPELLAQLQDYKGAGCPAGAANVATSGSTRTFVRGDQQPVRQQRANNQRRQNNNILNNPAVGAFIGSAIGGFIGSKF